MAEQFLQGGVSYEAQKEADILGKISNDVDLDAAAKLLGAETVDDLQNQIKDNTGNFFGIPTIQSEIDPEEATRWFKTEMAKKLTDKALIDEYKASGNPWSEEDDAYVAELRDKYDLDKTMWDVGAEALGSIGTSAMEFFGQAGNVLKNEQGSRDSLVGQIGDAFQSGIKDPVGFLDALSTLTADAFVDEIPEGIFNTAGDITSGMQGGRPTGGTIQKVNFDTVQGSVFSGQSTSDLKKAQPLASFIAGIVPYVVQGARAAGNIPKAVAGEFALDTTTGSINTVQGDTLKERNKARAVNAAVTVLATLGIETGMAGLRKVVNGKIKKGLTKVEAVRETVDELNKKAADVVSGKTPINAEKVAATVEKYGVDLPATAEEIAKQPDQFKVAGTKSAKASAEAFKESISTTNKKLADIKNKYNQVKAKVSALTGQADEVDAQLALVDKMKQQQKIVDDIQTKLDRTSKHKSAKTEYKRTSDDLAKAKGALDETKALYRDLLDTRKKAFNTPEPDDIVKPTTKRSEMTKEQAARPQAGQRYEKIKGRSDEAVSRWGTVQKKAEVKAAVKKAETENIQQAKAVFKDEATARVSTAPETDGTFEIPGDGDYMDAITAVTSRYGLSTYANLKVNGTKRVQAVIDARIEYHHASKRIMNSANAKATEIYNQFSKDLKLPQPKAVEQYITSGKYRAWDEGLLPESALNSTERKAFENFKKADVEYNKMNLDNMEALGIETKNLNPEAYTDSSAGDKVITVDVTNKPELRTQIEDAGYKVIELEPTKKVPDMPTRQYVVVKYAQSAKAVAEELDKGRIYYEQKAPFLFDKDGKLKTDLLQEEQNVTQTLVQLEREASLLPEQVGQIKGKLLEQGYPPEEISELLNDITSGNMNMEAIRTRIRKMHVGSLRRKEGSLVGVNLDPLNARRRQNIQLGKKMYRDNMIPVIEDAVKKIDQKLAGDSAKLTDHDVAMLRQEKQALTFIADDVNNRPGPIEKVILNGLETGAVLAGKGGSSRTIFRGLRNAMDSNLAVQSVAKLWLNVSGATANLVEVLRTTADAGVVIGEKRWGYLYDQLRNPGKLIQTTESKMAASKKYSEYYLENSFDASVDTRYAGKKHWGTVLTDNRVAKVGMMPFSGSIKFAKAYAYNIGEAIADGKGLAGQAKDDFIFNFMTERRQIPDMNVTPLASNDSVVKSALWLKNFLVTTAEYEVDAYRRALGSVLKRKVDKEAFGRVAAMSVGPQILFGLGASPTASILAGAWGAGTGVVEWVAGMAGMEVDIPGMEDLRGADRGSFAGLLGRGVVGELTGISTKQMTIDPLAAMGQESILVQEAKGITEWIVKGVSAARAAALLEDPNVFWMSLWNVAEQQVRTGVPAFGRAAKSADIMAKGVVTSAAGFPIDGGISVQDRPFRAIGTALGYNPTEVDVKYEGLAKGKSLREALEIQKDFYADTAAFLIRNGREKQADKLLDDAFNMGFDIGDEAVQNRVDRKSLTQDALFVESLTDEEYDKIKSKMPTFVDTAEKELEQASN